ncbi:hypothetical protein HW555_001524 [Spodoptera exigua]|uniref:CCHC-type domain-containing protein n=1 Tax=Spodoptera exigua TaxID=7107 RepID=A0A835L8U5_SPOEX|nr:hypothetical protein HW555_001524 [Spodoptera exigua]
MYVNENKLIGYFMTKSFDNFIQLSIIGKEMEKQQSTPVNDLPWPVDDDKEVKKLSTSKSSSCPGTKGRTTRSHFKRPATPMGGVASDSGESDCSQLSSVSQMSTASKTARARKRTRTTAWSAQAAVESMPESDKDALDRLAKENADLRSQVASLKEAVSGLKNQLNLLSQQGAQQKSQDLSVSAGLAPDTEAQLRRSIAIEVGAMMDAKLAALEGRLLPEKSLRPALASDTRRLASSKPDTTTWSLVVGRKAKRASAPQPMVSFASAAQSKPLNKPSVKLPKVPTSAAITVRVREGSNVGLGEVLAEARRRISLSEFGITSDSCREKRAADGGIVFMISGENSSAKADRLASRMREVLGEFDVQIGRPTKFAEARVMDLNDAVTPEEVAVAIARAGGCSTEEIKIGEIRRPPLSLGHVWVRGPLVAMKKLASDKRMPLGWTSVRVEVLEPRRMMCYRCFESGHVRRMCTSSVDRSSQCYACGGAHKARECISPILKCPVCSDQGRPSNHRLGGKNCQPQKKQSQKKLQGTGNGYVTFPALKVLQCNLNHCRSAQNLFLQTVAKWSVALAVVAEPYGLQDHPRWFRDTVDSVAIYWAGGSGGPHCALLDRGQGVVAVEWGPLAVVGCYVSPNISIPEFEIYLDGVANCVRYKCLPRPVLILEHGVTLGTGLGDT